MKIVKFIKSLFEYILITIGMFIFTKYFFSISILPNDVDNYKKGSIVLLDKISNVNENDKIVLLTETEYEAITVNSIYDEDDIYGKIIIKIWPFFN